MPLGKPVAAASPSSAPRASSSSIAAPTVGCNCPVQPFEDRAATFQRALDIPPVEPGGEQPIALELRAHGFRADRQQVLAWQTEQPNGVVVDVHETIAVDVEHDDRFGCVLDERAVARFALAQNELAQRAPDDSIDGQRFGNPAFQAFLRHSDPDLARRLAKSNAMERAGTRPP